VQLSFGEFLGREVNRVSVPGFIVTLRRSGSCRVDAKPHTHLTPNILFPLEEGYWSEADKFDDRNPSQLIYTPGGTMHRDSMVRLGGRYLAISLSNRADDPLADVRNPVALRRPNALKIAWAIAANNLTGDLRELFTEDACLNIVAELEAHLEAGKRRPPGWLRQVVELCNGTLKPLPRICEIAAQVGVHPVHVTRVFRSHYGLPLSKYIAAVRTQRAAEKLRAGALSVAEIAAETGFTDHSHLCKTFRLGMGMAPAKYRALFL
jgi:AraC family transcriptional regulator